jgi:hypothetical protein
MPIFQKPAQSMLERILYASCAGKPNHHNISILTEFTIEPNGDANETIVCSYHAGMNMVAAIFFYASVHSHYCSSLASASTTGLSSSEGKNNNFRLRPFLELLAEDSTPSRGIVDDTVRQFFEDVMSLAGQDAQAKKVREEIEYDAYCMFSLWLRKMAGMFVFFMKPFICFTFFFLFFFVPFCLLSF